MVKVFILLLHIQRLKLILQNIITELLQNYRLDGIHFDYIRYHDIGYGMNPNWIKVLLNYSGNIPGIQSIKIQEKPSFSEL